MEKPVKAYPTDKQMPNRKQRKALRKQIFWDNRLGDGSRRKRAEARKPGAKR